MRISDWSSDVCSSDLTTQVVQDDAGFGAGLVGRGDDRLFRGFGLDDFEHGFSAAAELGDAGGAADGHDGHAVCWRAIMLLSWLDIAAGRVHHYPEVIRHDNVLGDAGVGGLALPVGAI